MIARLMVFNMLTLYKITPFQHHYKEDTNKHAWDTSAQGVCSHQVANGTSKLMPSRG